MKIFQGRRADFSWGHLSIEGIEHVTESFGKAVWDANDQVVANPNLLVRITVEAALRQIIPGSVWRRKETSTARAVTAVEFDNEYTVHFQSLDTGAHHVCPSTRAWYRENEWVSDPEPKP